MFLLNYSSNYQKVRFFDFWRNFTLVLDSHNSFDLLSSLLDLQQDMIVMLLSMLEGNIVNGTIGKQLLDTLIESQQDVESIIRYFTMFLKLTDVIETEKFREIDPDGKNLISRRDFQRQLETSKRPRSNID